MSREVASPPLEGAGNSYDLWREGIYWERRNRKNGVCVYNVLLLFAGPGRRVCVYVCVYNVLLLFAGSGRRVCVCV